MLVFSMVTEVESILAEELIHLFRNYTWLRAQCLDWCAAGLVGLTMD